MTTRRSFLKSLALAAGGATIASKAVSAILTRPEHKSELQRVPDTQNGHSVNYSEELRAIWGDGKVDKWYLREVYPPRYEIGADGNWHRAKIYVRNPNPAWVNAPYRVDFLTSSPK